MQFEIKNGPGRMLKLKSTSDAIQAVRRAGSVTIGLTPIELKTSGARVALVSSQRKGLHLPGRWRVSVRTSEHGLSLGPVIAIFTSSSRKNPKRRFAASSGQFRRLILVAKEMGAIAYVFTPEGVNWSDRTIAGYTISGRSGAWVRGRFPFPHVIYNRVPNRNAERRASVDAARKRFIEESDVHFFNPKLLDKWEVHNILKDHEAVKAHLPETLMYRDATSLMEFLRKHHEVYMKRAGGSLGNGTARIDLHPNGRILWRSTLGKGRIRAATYYDIGAFSAQLDRFQAGRRYLIQQAIPLLRYHGRPFDIRALVQNDPVKGWTVTGMAARIAGPRQITTHRPRGGSRAKLIPLLRRVLKGADRVDQVVRNLENAIVTAAAAFDAATGGTHGELSMDVALDRSGHPWILELNAKPMVFDEPAIRKHARRRLVRYCFTVGGFQLPSAPRAKGALASRAH